MTRDDAYSGFVRCPCKPPYCGQCKVWRYDIDPCQRADAGREKTLSRNSRKLPPMTRDEIVNRIVQLSAAILLCPDSEALLAERHGLKVKLGQLDADAAERRRDIADKWRDDAPNRDGNQYEPY